MGAQLLLQRVLVVQLALFVGGDVDIDAGDIHLLALLEHPAAGVEPVVDAAVVFQAIFHATFDLVDQELQKPGVGTGDVLGMDGLNPAAVAGIGAGGVRVQKLAQLRVHPEHIATGQRQPYHRRQLLQHQLEIGQAVSQAGHGGGPVAVGTGMCEQKALHAQQLLAFEHGHELHHSANQLVDRRDGAAPLHAVVQRLRSGRIVAQQALAVAVAQLLQFFTKALVHEGDLPALRIDAGTRHRVLFHALGHGDQGRLLGLQRCRGAWVSRGLRHGFFCGSWRGPACYQC